MKRSLLAALLLLLVSPLQGALILHYGLDQESGTTATDASSSLANGTLLGAGSSWTSSVPSSFVAEHAYRNSGAKDTMISAGKVSALESLGALTITGWVNVHAATTTVGGQDRLLSSRGMAAADGYFDLSLYSITGGTALRFEVKNNSATANSALNSSVVDLTSGWLYFAVTWDGTTGQTTIHIGTTDAAGALQSVGTGTLKTGVIDGSTNIFTIGNIAINTDRAPEADFSDIRIYNNVLSETELNTVRLANLQAIPEPSATVALVAGCGIMLAGCRLRTPRRSYGSRFLV